MPLSNIPFKPGFYTEATDREVGKGLLWKTGDHVRFFEGKPTKLGGWVKLSQSMFQGKARAAIDWVSTRQEYFMAFGTHKKLYVVQGGTLYDITPIRISGTEANNPFTTTNGSAIVSVAHNGHGCIVGDYVHYSGATVVGGLTISGEYTVTGVTNANAYTITAASNANANATGGGNAVAYSYEINVGNEYAVQGLGWGAGTWGASTWGTPRATSGLVLQSRVWSLAIWGEDLLANVYDGAIYVWRSSLGTANRATRITQAPATNKGIYVAADERQIVALGAHDGVSNDPLLIRWCSMEDYTLWTPLLSNTAGDKRLEYGNEIYCALFLRGETLIFTDTHLYAMTLVGLPDIYAFRPLGANSSLFGPHAVAAYNGISYWVAKGGFYRYDGTITELQCPVFTQVFGDFNHGAGRHIYAAVNSAFSEIWWLYASSESNELDRYVIYNTIDNSWVFGTIARTVMVGDSKYTNSVYAASPDGYLYSHEFGSDADGAVLDAYLESGDIEIDDGGEYLMHIGQFIPDMLSLNGEISLTITGKKYPQDSEVQTSGPHAITNATPYANPRVRCRQLSFKF
ncbi:hypothetical protein EPO05_06790, partial [Patescibacteria group bacterium]